MKKFLLLLPALILSVCVFAQSLSHVNLTGATTLVSFGFTTNDKAVIKISPDGNILEWGTELEPGRNGYYQGKLQPYMGRVDYYGQDAEEASRGKVKSIGSTTITYYSSTQPEAQKGKIKSIGTAQFDYYMSYDNESFRGKLKSAGSSAFSYYGSFDNEALRGKLKAAGNNSLTYYTVFDDRYNKGKIKSIGSFGFTWYNEADRKELQGAMKTGATIQKINGVTFNVW